MKGFRARAAVGTVALAAAFALALLSQAGVASAATKGFNIYNFTGATLKLDDVSAHGPKPVFEEPSSSAPAPPQKGDLLSPGEVMHIEMTDKWSIVNNSNLREAFLEFSQFTSPTSLSSRKYSVYLATGESNVLGNQVVVHCTATPGHCPVDGTAVKMLDPPGTHTTIPATDAPAQAAVMADVCTQANGDSGGTCKFDPQKKEHTTVPNELVGEPVVNCLPEKIEPDVEVEHKVGTTNSLEVGAEFELEQSYVIGKVKYAVSTKYGHEWINETTVKQKVPLPIEPHQVGYVVHATPVVRFTGDFTLTVGNSTFTLTGVYFDHPDTARTGQFYAKEREATLGEMQNCKRNDSKAFVRLPASAVTSVRSATTGSDILRGGPENEVFRGLSGNDIMGGGGGNDTLFAGPGDDLLVGSSGHDVINGGPGADMMIDTRGPALVHTGASRPGRGWDYVYVRDGRADDTVICSSRHTIVAADKGDRVRGRCGDVIRRGPVDKPTLPLLQPMPGV